MVILETDLGLALKVVLFLLNDHDHQPFNSNSSFYFH